jgi:hypothetical protein
MYVQESGFEMDEDVLAMGGQLCTIISKRGPMRSGKRCKIPHPMHTRMACLSMEPLSHVFSFFADEHAEMKQLLGKEPDFLSLFPISILNVHIPT